MTLKASTRPRSDAASLATHPYVAWIQTYGGEAFETATRKAVTVLDELGAVMQKEGGFSLADKGDYVAGHSLGEYSALCAVEAFDIGTTARLLKLRGQAMQAAVPVGEGAMAALLGADIDKAQALADAAAQGEVCTVANDNDPSETAQANHGGRKNDIESTMGRPGGRHLVEPVI